MKPIKLLTLFLLLTNICFGQFSTTAKLKNVSENGFHEIKLSSEIRSFSKQDLGDIRIFNAKQNEIPYLVLNNNTIPSNIFQEYDIVSKTTNAKKNTSVVIKILPQQKNNQLCLYIANSNSTKKYTVSGSNDQKEWYGISDSQVLSDLKSPTETSVVKTISYPLHNYQFLKIDFDDQKTLPVNVLRAGNFITSAHTDQLTELKPKKSSVKEIPSKKETEIHVVFEKPEAINQLVFEISKPTHYNRQVVLYKKSERQVKRKTQIYEEEIVSFELNSNVKNSFTIPELFEKEFFIKIKNQDNLPLTISSIKYNQKPISIIADLNAGEQYTLKTGNKNLAHADYDLSGFKNEMQRILPQVTLSNVQHQTEVKTENQQKSFWQQSWFMWTCIVLGGLVILFFTTSLVKDLKKQN